MCKRSIIFLIACFLGVALTGGALEASQITADLNQADSLYAQGKYAECIDTLKKAMAVAWEKSPLTLQKVSFIKHEPTAEGAYERRRSAVFRKNEELHLYFEPTGYKLKKISDTTKELFLKLDWYLLDMKGKILTGQEDALTFRKKAGRTAYDIFMWVSLPLAPIPPGKYKFKGVVKDGFSNKKAAVVREFQVK